MEIYEKVDVQYFTRVMRSFNSKVLIDLKLAKFYDENHHAEKVIELLSYF